MQQFAGSVATHLRDSFGLEATVLSQDISRPDFPIRIIKTATSYGWTLATEGMSTRVFESGTGS